MPSVKLENLNRSAVLNGIERSGLSMVEVSRRIGRGDAYLSASIRRGMMSAAAIPLLAKELDIPQKDLILHQEEQKTCCAKDAVNKYTAQIEVSKTKLHMTLLFGGKELYSTYSRIKGGSELDLMQAVSYAAHLMYKLAEQEELKKDQALK